MRSGGAEKERGLERVQIGSALKECPGAPELSCEMTYSHINFKSREGILGTSGLLT